MVTGIRGIINNNPVNIKALGATSPRGEWKGCTGQDSEGHAIFVHPVYALRAAIADLSHDYCVAKPGKKTLKELFAEYAPANDIMAHNDPLAYAKFMAGRLGITIDSDVALFKPDRSLSTVGAMTIRAFLSAIVEYEIMSGWRLEDSLLANAVLLYKKEPPGS